MYKFILFTLLLICFGLIFANRVFHEEVSKPSSIEAAKVSKLPTLKPEEIDQRFESLATQTPQEKLKELKAQFDQASARYNRSLREYEILERHLGRQILASTNPASDRTIERLHEELRGKFSNLQNDNEEMTNAAANLNRRLLKLAQKMIPNGGAR